ncbi:MAG: KpsF/GutQ family sugar-phosphate isomerase [Aureispira sp.]|nr:KpsF/GutQ family sugar-phosphate isomerase [Aureispira sp.]
MDLLKIAQQVFTIEAQAIEGLAAQLDEQFVQAVEVLDQCKGRVLVCGMGKSGVIGKKITATLASIGRSSFFLHPTEAIHGDLGLISTDDCFLSISNSGETDEILQLIPHIRKRQLKHICLVGNIDSTLAHHADFVLNVAVAKEASHIQAVPMASTTATLAMGDALAAALIKLRGFEQEDFALLHPGGSLGRKLVVKIQAVMRTEDLPIAKKNTSISEVLMHMSAGMLGIVVICGQNSQIEGIITDGDLRRALTKHQGESFFSLMAKDIMTNAPKTILPDQPLWDAEEMMLGHKITTILVAKNNKLLGLIAKHHIR